MKTARWRRSFAAYLAIVSVLFAQLAVAAYACPGIDRMAVAAVAAMPDMPGCDMADQEKPTPLCQAHCQQGDQSLDKPVPSLQVVAIASAHPVVALVARGLVPARQLERFPDPFLERPTEPPAALRHCRFHI